MITYIDWEEITKNLAQNQQPWERDDLIVRVFNMKVKELLHDLTVKGILGSVKGYIYVVEYQGRGLPHIHILLILCNQDKPRTPDDFDHLVSAEIPNKVTHPILYERVTTHMLHGMLLN